MFFERHQSGERAILVHLEMGQEGEREDANELKELVYSAGADPLQVIGGSRATPHPKTYVQAKSKRLGWLWNSTKLK